MFETPLAEINNTSLTIKLPKHFRDRGWSNGFGLIQDKICNYVNDSNGHGLKRVSIDFSSCRWVDPLPLMSVLLEVAFIIEHKIVLDIHLPNPDSGPLPSEKGIYHESPNRLLRYFVQEGFFDSLNKLSKAGDLINFFSKPSRGWGEYRNLKVRPSYEDANCIPLCLLDVPKNNEEFVKNTLEKLINGVHSKLKDKIGPQTCERLISRLRVAIQELLHNAQEHAYPPETISGPLALYVRYRTGGIGRDSFGKEIFQTSIQEEALNCPRLRKEWLSDRSGCLELFVMDKGIGMVRSFENAGYSFDHKHRFNEVIQKTFCEGKSTKPERQTLYGGLHLLHNLLNGSYLRALEGNLWVGCGIPLFRDTEATFRIADSSIQGLALHFRLGWKEETDQGEEWFKFQQGQESEVWNELKLSEDECAQSIGWFQERKVIDERFESVLDEKPTPFEEFGTEGDWILWLVRPHRMKWDIISFIRNTISKFATGNTVLIIADIPSYEAMIYEAALGEFKIRGDDWPSKFSHVILVSNRWRFAMINYEKDGTQHGFSKLHHRFKRASVPNLPIKPRPKNFRLGIIRWLKWHDSRRIWDEVKKGNSIIIPEKIAWETDKDGYPKTIIDGYFDFPQTIHNDLCLSVYRASLTRVLGVLPLEYFSIAPLDRLTMTVLREIFANEVYEKPESALPREKLALGSVLVSGNTLAVSAPWTIDLHFFIHCNSSLRGTKSSLLFWLFPKEHISKMPPRLARIGKTASVAPEGWKSFEVPRFDNDEKCIGIRNPQLTYKDWQAPSPVIVKAGHWVYEGHHDFITINIASAVETAFLSKNELARFLTTRILSFIGLEKKHIDKNWHKLFDMSTSVPSDACKDNYGLLVYHSHPSSEYILRKLLSLLTNEGKELALQRIFSILPVRMRWSGSTLLIPPLVKEGIKKALKENENPRRILLFDDATITGRTLHDLHATLSSIGAEDISTMVIANRLRQPADGCGSWRFDYFWRLDVPAIGREGNCPLCHSLQLADEFSSSLAATNAKQVIRNWRQRWGAQSPMDSWNGGIHPLPLTREERGTKYCYRANMSKKGLQYKHFTEIDLIRSTGLIIHVSELHAMTGRDDYCLKKILEHKEPEIRIELAVCQLLLFGNEFDNDIRIELIITLIKELTRIRGDSPHSALAVITIVREIGLFDFETQKLLISKINYGKLDLKSNYDNKILLAYFVTKNLLSQNSFAHKLGKKLLSSSSWSKAERLNAFYLETLSVQGNSHSEDIPLLINELSSPQSHVVDILINGAKDSLDHLEDIVEFLEGIERKDAKGEHKRKIHIMKDSHRTSQELLKGYPNKKNDLRISLEKYLENMKKVADAYFHRIPSASNYYKNHTFSKAVIDIFNNINWKAASQKVGIQQREYLIKISRSGAIAFNENAGEIWIAWFKGIPSVIHDLMRNAIYASNQTIEPWVEKSQSREIADLWVRIDYGEKAVTIILANAVKKDPKQIFPKIKNRWCVLESIGGSVMLTEIADNILGVKVKIPYAGFLYRP